MSKNINAKKAGFTFNEVCLSFIEVCRYYTVILSKLQKVPFKGVSTAGVGFNKHGKLTMFYNPDFIISLPLEEAQGLVEHECCHIVYRHLSRFPLRNTAIKDLNKVTMENINALIKDMHENKIMNWGTDMAINQYIAVLPTFQANDPAVKAGMVKAGENMGIYPETHKMPKGMAAEYYVNELRKLFPEPPPQQGQSGQQKMKCNSCDGSGKLAPPKPQQGQGQPQDKGQDSNQGQGDSKEQGQDGKPQDGQGNQPGQGQGEPQFGPAQGNQPCPDCGGSGKQDLPSMDSHDLWGKVIEVAEDGTVTMSDVKDHADIDPEFECESVVMKAMKECKDYGKIPAHIQAELERLKAVKRHDWKRTFRVFMNTALTVDKKRTQKRVDRRLATLVPYLAPGKKKSKRPKVLYVRDTSGSMFNQSVQDDINMELENVAKRAEVYVVDADTKVHGKAYRVRTASDIKASKGGGGTCFKDAFKIAIELNVDVVVYATDTHGSFPDVKDIGKLARATLWLTLGQETVTVPFGQHINIDPAEYADKKK